ncbi:MAG: hypothetical protein KGR26_12960 [Cyanobacteria bacterium REEB65]|nr:hypothetical protein [Cyanobacteria bacterium REEB65]
MAKKRPRAKREWYVAIGDVSGEYEGNPLCFVASHVYGPYTAGQALIASKLGDEFPHATSDVWIFKASRPSYRELLSHIKAKLAEAKEDAAERQREARGES